MMFRLIKSFYFDLSDYVTFNILKIIVKFPLFIKQNYNFLLWHRNWGFGHQIVELAYAQQKLHDNCKVGMIITCGDHNNSYLFGLFKGCISYEINFKHYSNYFKACDYLCRNPNSFSIGFTPIDSFFYYCLTNELSNEFYLIQEKTEKKVRNVVSNNELSLLIPTSDQNYFESTFAKRLGLSIYSKFVCLHVRKTQWSKHRNNEINNYKPAIKYLNSLGIKTILFGETTNIQDDYDLGVYDFNKLFHKDNKELMIVNLLKNQYFMLAINSGPMCISTLFDVPVLLTNNTEWDYPPYRRKDRYLPKLIMQKNKSRLITTSEFIDNRENGLINVESISSDFSYIDNTSDEIFIAVKNLINDINNNFIEDRTQAQSIFRSKFSINSTINFSNATVDQSFYTKYLDIFEN